MRSNIYIYLLYKYIFLYLSIGTVDSFFKLEDYSFDSIKSQLILLFVFLTLHFFISRVIYRASVDKIGIRLNKNIFIKWEEVDSLNRTYHVYSLRKKNNKKIFLFPISNFPIKLLGNSIEDGHMDQIINKMCEKYGI